MFASLDFSFVGAGSVLMEYFAFKAAIHCQGDSYTTVPRQKAIYWSLS